MSTLRVVERIEDQAVSCRKCDKCMVGGTLPARYSLCGKCATSDARPRVNSYMRRTKRRRQWDHFLDRYLPFLLQVGGGITVAVAVGYWLLRAMGLVR